ncbi:plasmid replication protein, CyRepA1 family [Crocosphaera sp. XPORK-15E]|uniref:plasmid replication protein, CyRepA1 family n=1 Tax=Crocosphaera sp. XPORK-15E TaxID=3110247 RepID=UPI002B1F01F0|nr:plasmid replication protein, CyRepA1 family [Crocosphaera sp. XPORK-15E]MEA5536718.1 plasmid replication protein, CyRepA1 family [Crocosphaera sp. XPORK-15E]
MNHQQEWLNSRVDAQLIALNVTALAGTSPSEYLLYSEALPRRNDGRVNNTILKRYEHTEQGGWWCSGVDVMTGNEDLWGCFKPDQPRLSYNAHKPIKYEHPPQVPTGIFALKVPLHLWEQVGQRHQINFTSEIIDETQPDRGFWSWVIAHPTIPLCITEGAKKAGALLTAGYAAIALPGINNGYRTPKDEAGNRIGKSHLIPQLQKLATPGRTIYIIFDQDSKPNTIKAVNAAIKKLGYLFTQTGCHVKVITWASDQGKGIDDFIINQGQKAFDELYQKALPLETWKARELTQLTYPANLEVNCPYLQPFPIPNTAKLIGIKSAIGTGKTQVLETIVNQAIAQKQKVLVIGHRIKLVEQLCQRFGLPYITEVRENSLSKELGYGLCIDSLHENSQANFNPDDWQDALVIIDEVEQVIWHGLNSETCNHHRVPILKSLKTLIQNVLGSQGKLVIADADLSDISLDYLMTLSGINLQPFIVKNHWKPKPTEAWEAYNYPETTPKRFLKDLVEHIRQGGKPFVCLSAQKLSSKWGTQTLESYLQKQFPTAKILRIDSESLTDPNHGAYQCITNLNDVLVNYDIVLTSPSIETGVSIDLKGHFTSVWCLAQGVQTPSSICQSLGRIRENIPRYLWLASYGFNKVGNGSTSIPNLLTSGHRLTQLNIRLLQQSDLEYLDDLDTGFQAESLLCWAKMSVRVNAQMINYRDSILSIIQSSNHQINPPPKIKKLPQKQDNKYDSVNELTETIEQVQEQNYKAECEAIAKTKELSDQQYQTLKKRLVKTNKERRALKKYDLQRRYCIPVTPQLVALDDDGWYQKLRIHYFLTMGRNYLADRDTIVARKLIEQGQGGVFLPDFNGCQLGAIIGTMEVLGIPTLLRDIQRRLINRDPDLIKLAEIAINNRSDIKTIMGIGIAKNASPITIIRRLLDKIGYGLTGIGTQKIEQKRVRVYQVVTPNDGREEVFQQWLLRDQKSPGSSEPWFEEYLNLKVKIKDSETPVNHIQLSLDFS